MYTRVLEKHVEVYNNIFSDYTYNLILTMECPARTIVLGLTSACLYSVNIFLIARWTNSENIYVKALDNM